MYRGHKYPGLFISFEGPDGSGKSTQYRKLVNHLKESGICEKNVIQVREPGGTRVGESVRDILLSSDSGDIDPFTELLLFEASRAQLVSQRIRPALEDGRIVLADRFYDSSMAYQGTAGKVPLDLVALGNRLATQGIFPDRTYIFDVSYEQAQRRAGINRPLNTMEAQTQTASGKSLFVEDRIEAKDREFRERVRQGYLGLAKIEPDRIRVISTDDLSPEKVFQELIADFTEFCKQLNYPICQKQ